MAEAIINSLLKPAMEALGRLVVVKIKHLFTYLCCFSNNIQGLTNEAQKLEDARVGLQRQVEAAENNAEVILPQVSTWLEVASEKIEVIKKQIVDDIPTVKNDCWTVKSRYQLSRKAVKLTGVMKQLMEEHSKITNIATPALPAAQAEIPIGPTHDFQTRKQIEEEVMKALEAKEVTTIGICGMGGVGKTTMAKRIMVRVKKEDIFQEIFMVVVSQQVDMLKIQGAIAESLGSKLDVETLEARATKLRARLMGGKRILIVIDDVWEKLKLEDLGIPCGNELCTILLTSRNKDLLTKMNAQIICGVEILSETEAWSLFKATTSSCVDDPNLSPTAEKVARECKGLPLALITVGGALKDQTSISIWEDALQQLQSYNPEDISDVIKNVYNHLKLSYTKLESSHAKSVFLLCSLFPEDVDISLEELTLYCIGLRIFSNLDSSNTSERVLEKVRRRVFTIVDALKNRFLLIESDSEHHVRMHDVIRDVAIYIASHEANEEIVKFNPMGSSSSEYIYESISVFSEISSLLRMHGSQYVMERYKIKDFSFFKGMEELNLLSLEDIVLKPMPMEIQFLKNLRTLRLMSCELKSLSVVGELLSLEILYCYHCYEIEELPVEIGNLNQLKLLDFSHCSSIRRIPPGVVSNLVQLEEFKMIRSFAGWELAGQERRNACLNEFEHLSKLTCLEVAIEDINLVGEEICFSPNIERYQIEIGVSHLYHDIAPSHAKGVCARLPNVISLGGWFLRFLRSADKVELMGDGSIPLDLPQAHRTKSLTLEYCSAVKEVVNSTTTSIHDDLFPILEDLCLSNLPNLEEVYDGTGLDQCNSFRNLQRLELNNLPALKHLCNRPSENVSLDKLREIKIENCSNLHNLFSFPTSIWTDRDVDELLCTQKVFFPMLETIQLAELDKLEVIWCSSIPEGSNSFNNLRELTLRNLPALTNLWKNSNLSVSLSCLSQICIYECHKLCSLFSSTMSMKFLSQLAKLEIDSCKMMEQVLLNEENKNEGNQCPTIKFSKLSKLTLFALGSLTAFGKGIASIEFPMLEDMDIKDCPNLMSLHSSNGTNEILADGNDDDTFHLFCSQKISYGNLKRVSISVPGKSNIWCQCRQISASFFGQIEELKIVGCGGIRSLFSSSIAENLVNIKKLKIWQCDEMVKVMEDDEMTVLFPSLKELDFRGLPKLESFCNWGCDFQLPSLEKVYISECPSLEFFTMKCVTTPNLKSINFGWGDRANVRDLNHAVQKLNR